MINIAIDPSGKTLHDMLLELDGEIVVAAVSTEGIVRDGFHTQISLLGKLEINPGDNTSFRVLNTKNCYAYFMINDVYCFNMATEKPIINLRIDTPQDV